MNEKRLLEGKNVLITGCSRGMGKTAVSLFASHGANIWAHARSYSAEFEDYVQAEANKHNVFIKPIYIDLTNESEIKRGVKEILSDKMDIDVLVNNAGITYNALFQMTSTDKVKEVMNINFMAPFLLTQYVVRSMIKKRSGSIITISSTAAIDANQGRSVYGASKAAIQCATIALAHELGEYEIRANVICPGITKTDMISSMSDNVINETIINTDMQRIGETIDIANAMLFLSSDLSSYVTGQILRVDGGMK